MDIEWGTSTINIYKTDSFMTLVQSAPTVIYDLNLNAFRLALKDAEDSDAGMAFLRTHKHNTEVSLGGLTFARTIEIINGYTITPEDGQYAVNLVGANSNVGDRVNVNQVSVRSQNSAGMTSSPEIEYASFDQGVSYDATSPFSGTAFPNGTRRQPINNMMDAKLIANYRGFSTGYIYGSLTMDGSAVIDNFTMIGESPTKTLIHILPEATANNCTYKNATLLGTLDGKSTIVKCMLSDLSYIYGHIEECVLAPGTITLSGGADAYFFDCKSGITAHGNYPIIDMGGTGQSVRMAGYTGVVKIINKTGDADVCSFDLNSGTVIIDTATVSGMIVARGIGKLVDTDDNPIVTGTHVGLVVINELVNQGNIADSVWAKEDAQKLLEENLGHAVISPDNRHVTIRKRSDNTISHEFDISADKRIRNPA